MANKIWTGATDTAWATSGNWSPVNAPGATGDSAYFNETATGVSGLAGSDQSATTLDSLIIKQAYAYVFGTDGTPLKVKSTLVHIGEASGSSVVASGSGRINLDLSTVATTIFLYNSSSSSSDLYKEPVRIKAVNAANVLHASGGRIGIATDSVGDVATFGTVNITGPNSFVNLSSGVTLTTLNQSDGTCNINNAITTVNLTGGTFTSEGDYTIATLNLTSSASLNHRKTAGNSITTLNLYDGAYLDLSGNAGAISIGTINVYGDAIIKCNSANPGHLTWTTLTRNPGVTFELV